MKKNIKAKKKNLSRPTGHLTMLVGYDPDMSNLPRVDWEFVGEFYDQQ
jgi:hypothetical protein